MISCVGSCVTSWPSKITLPPLARGVPQMVISSEVLPAPLEPISETISPWLTCRVTSLTAQIAP